MRKTSRHYGTGTSLSPTWSVGLRSSTSVPLLSPRSKWHSTSMSCRPESLGSIRRRFRAIFPTYVGARDPAKKRLAENLVEQLSTLQELRNAIVHAGGFIVDKKWSENMERLPGIFLLAGTVYVSQEGRRP